jgi:hypothetical protein
MWDAEGPVHRTVELCHSGSTTRGGLTEALQCDVILRTLQLLSFAIHVQLVWNHRLRTKMT